MHKTYTSHLEYLNNFKLNKKYYFNENKLIKAPNLSSCKYRYPSVICIYMSSIHCTS